MLKVAVIFLVFAACLAAQVENALLNGVVTDATGSVIAGAAVTAVSSLTGLRRHKMTTNAGAYQLAAMPVGVYTITIGKTGFRSSEYNDLELPVGLARTINAELAVGTITIRSK